MTDEKERVRIGLLKAVQKSPQLLATGRRAKAPSVAQERLRSLNAAATQLLSKPSASLEELNSAFSSLEDAQLWVLDPGSSTAEADVDAVKAKLRRFKELVQNSQAVEGLSKKEKKAEADALRIELTGQLVAPADELRRALATEFRGLCEELDRKIARTRNRRRSSSSVDSESGQSSVLSWLSQLWNQRGSEQQRQVQLDGNAALREWNATDSFAQPVPRMDAAALNQLSYDASKLSEATERVASMVQGQTESLDAVEEDIHQTVEETKDVVGTLADVAIGKSRSRVSKATMVVGASGALVGAACGAPLLGTMALAGSAATITAVAGNLLHSRYSRKVREVATASH